MEVEGYCVKCRTKRTITQSKVVNTSKGRPMAKGVCPECCHSPHFEAPWGAVDLSILTIRHGLLARMASWSC